MEKEPLCPIVLKVMKYIPKVTRRYSISLRIPHGISPGNQRIPSSIPVMNVCLPFDGYIDIYIYIHGTYIFIYIYIYIYIYMDIVYICTYFIC